MHILKPLALNCYKLVRIFIVRHGSWTDKGIIPDIIEAPPQETLIVKYPKVTISEGSIVRAKETKYTPKVTWDVKEKGNYYTLVMSDLDAPSRQKPVLREWHHWLVGNIPDNNLEQGQVLTEYIGAGPPKGTGLHSYKISRKQYKGRPKFSSNAFKMKHNLQLYAGNFYEAEYDDFVDELHKQICLEEFINLTSPHPF